ncbi:MAG: ribonuclease HI family protein [Limosilactobacillus sp.]|jgi:ribonuclease HI|uniref:ribonuclease HI family protein n=1 Tax=Limosilactobacillus sp. TaxID=2773925 RepID=UPI0025BDEE87|nr:ribonuclease HI family protein [Limosilactobacillus sp.]MCI1975163.1 ribonuclease HI family protein [Limosilactobacillus sp.]MCI2031544.1 ribonuclease HI family protein [Limosilactobacillus sp.]
MLKIYTDAATKGNPGPTGLGILIIDQHQQQQLSQTLKTATNHEGEFAAAIAGFQYLADHYDHNETVLFYTDSRLLSDAIGKNYTKHYQKQLEQLSQLLSQFTTVVTQWVSERENRGAHNLANQALQKLE